MNISQKNPYQLSVSYLYDPILLEDVKLDALKESFGDVQYSPEAEFIYVEPNQKKAKAQILSARLDYLDETEGEFSDRDLTPVNLLLKALPRLNVKGFGVTVYMSAQIAEEKDAGVYVARHLLAGVDTLERKLGAKIIAGAQRMTYGDAAAYFDLRITPAEIGGETVYLHLRKHQDKNLTDRDRIFEETLTAQKDTIAEFARVLQLI